MAGPQQTATQLRRPAHTVLGVFLRLGLTSFGGPVAHLAHFRQTLVVRSKWLADAEYADLVALSQFLPGPASSQVGFAIGLREAGLLGGLAAFVGFTLPSALLMLAAAMWLPALPAEVREPVFHGLVLAAVPVVAHAVVGMALRLCARPSTAVLAMAAMAMVLTAGHALAQPLAIVAGGLAGLAIGFPATPETQPLVRPATHWSIALLAAFAALLAVLPVLAAITHAPPVVVADAFYRAGALVFGGGHVVLPLLEAETVGRGWLDQQAFLSGYGAAQALPGPLFAFGAYLGAISDTGMSPLAGGLVGLLALFLPGLLLMAGALGPWRALKAQPQARGFVAGACAAVVGVLAAAFVDPVLPAGMRGPADGVIALAGFLALLARTPPWLVVVCVAAAGAYSSAG